MKKLLASGDDDPPAAMAEAESRGLRPSWARLWGWHPIVPPSSPAVASVAPARAPRLLLARGHEPHAVDLVAGRLVVDPVRDAPDAVQAPLEHVGRVIEEELLGFAVDLSALLLVERRTPRDNQLVQILVAVVAPGLAALEDIVEDGVGIEDRVVAPRPVEHGARLAIFDLRRIDGLVPNIVELGADAGLCHVGAQGLVGLKHRGFDDFKAGTEADVDSVGEPGVGEQSLGAWNVLLVGLDAGIKAEGHWVDDRRDPVPEAVEHMLNGGVGIDGEVDRLADTPVGEGVWPSAARLVELEHGRSENLRGRGSRLARLVDHIHLIGRDGLDHVHTA